MGDASVPLWVWILIGVSGVVLVAALGWLGGTWLWHRLSRRYLVQLIGRRENLMASQRTLEAVIRHLVDEPEESLIAFAEDLEEVDRKALVEVARRMEILSEELWTMPLPRRLWPLGEALGDAAATLEEEASRVGEGMGADDVLTGLAEIDVARVGVAFLRAERLMEEAREYYDVEDTAVYGGGLYI